MTKKPGNTGKRWEIEVKEQNQEQGILQIPCKESVPQRDRTKNQGALRSDTSEKLPGHQTFHVCHMCLQKGNGRCVLLSTQLPTLFFSP